MRQSPSVTYTRRKMDRLQRVATETAKARGHTLSAFVGDRDSAYAACVTCTSGVTLNTRPAANEIDMGGCALALNCC